jgi:hypothetical protein
MTEQLNSLIYSFDREDISNDEFLDKLCDEIQYIEKINQYGPDEKDKIIKILAKLKPEQDQKYSAIYLELARLPELWVIISHFNMTLLSYMAYGYDNSFFDCLFELAKYPKLWEFREEQHHYTPLHFLVFSIKNFGKTGAFPILERLSNYHNIWMIQSKAKNTPLHELCQFREKVPYEIFKNLVNNEYLWKIQNNSRMTPLHYLCTTRDKSGAFEIFKDLSKIENIWRVQDEFLYTPLHLICRNIFDKSNNHTENKDDSNLVIHLYNEFFLKMREFPELWIMQNKSGITPNDIFIEKEQERINGEYDVL